MAAEVQKVSNPLSLIAYFAGVSESVALCVLPILGKTSGTLPEPLIWFVVLFPTLIVVLFFATLNFNRIVLYAPSDFSDERHFVESLEGSYAAPDQVEEALRSFWKPDGSSRDLTNEERLRDWMIRNGYEDVSVTAFLYSSTPDYVQARRRLAQDFTLI